MSDQKKQNKKEKFEAHTRKDLLWIDFFLACFRDIVILLLVTFFLLFFFFVFIYLFIYFLFGFILFYPSLLFRSIFILFLLVYFFVFHLETNTACLKKCRLFQFVFALEMPCSFFRICFDTESLMDKSTSLIDGSYFEDNSINGNYYGESKGFVGFFFSVFFVGLPT